MDEEYMGIKYSDTLLKICNAFKEYLDTKMDIIINVVNILGFTESNCTAAGYMRNTI